MPENKGFIKLHRAILGWEWYGDINTRGLFIHLLLSACWEDTTYTGQVIKRGQLCTTVRELAEINGLTVKETRTALKHLQTTGEIIMCSTPLHSVITVVNYDLYQGADGWANKGQTSGTEKGKPKGKPAAEKTANDTNTKNGSVNSLESTTQAESGKPQTAQVANQTANKGQTSDTERGKPSLLNKEIKNIRREEYSGSLRQLLDEAVSNYNTVCKSLEPLTGELSYHQAHLVEQAFRELHGVSFEDYFGRVEASAFLTGKSGSGFKASFDWLIRPENVAKVLSGKYDITYGTAKDKEPEIRDYNAPLWD